MHSSPLRSHRTLLTEEKSNGTLPEISDPEKILLLAKDFSAVSDLKHQVHDLIYSKRDVEFSNQKEFETRSGVNEIICALCSENSVREVELRSELYTARKQFYDVDLEYRLEKQSYTDQIRDLVKEIQELKSEVIKSQKGLTPQKSKTDHQTSGNQMFEYDIQSLRSDLETANQNFTKTATLLENSQRILSQKELAETNQELENSEKLCVQLAVENATLVNEATELEIEIDRLKESFRIELSGINESHQSELYILRQKLENLDQNLVNTTLLLEESQRLLMQKESALSRASNEIHKLTLQGENCHQNLLQLTVKNASLQKEADNLKMQIDHFNATSRRELSSMNRSHQFELHNLHLELQKTRENLEVTTTCLVNSMTVRRNNYIKHFKTFSVNNK